MVERLVKAQQQDVLSMSKLPYMRNNQFVAHAEYIIDTENLSYKAVWNCQVEWTDECIFYDAETGTVLLEDDEPVFSCEHPVKVTKGEYAQHALEAKLLKQVSLQQLKNLLSLVSVK